MLSSFTDERIDETAAQSTNWYVARRIDVPAAALPDLELPPVVVAENGVSLAIEQPIYVDDPSYRSFEAVLTYPGHIPARLRVELDLNPYSSDRGELGLRPAQRMPRILVSAQRYFDGAWSVLDTLADELVAGRSGTGTKAGAGQAA